jgi:sulfate adenylyltransferase
MGFIIFTLIDRYLSGSKCEFVSSAARSLPEFPLSARNLADLECIATGVYSPLEGFVTEREYESIVQNSRLPNGLAWSIPVTLQMPAAEADKYQLDRDIALELVDGLFINPRLMSRLTLNYRRC